LFRRDESGEAIEASIFSQLVALAFGFGRVKFLGLVSQKGVKRKRLGKLKETTS
jgi:hypothetical protein